MAQIGNKQNAILNQEWGKHRNGGRNRDNDWWRRQTSKRRRKFAQHIIAEALLEKRIRLR